MTIRRLMRPFVKRFALCYRTVVYLSVLSVSDVGVLWPNCWMDQDETWRAGSRRPWPRSLRWGPSSPSPKGHSLQFSAHVCCDQTAVNQHYTDSRTDNHEISRTVVAATQTSSFSTLDNIGRHCWSVCRGLKTDLHLFDYSCGFTVDFVVQVVVQQIHN